MNKYPYPKDTVDAAHIIWAYDNTLFAWAKEGLSVNEMQRRLREENLYVSHRAILSVIGGRTKGV